MLLKRSDIERHRPATEQPHRHTIAVEDGRFSLMWSHYADQYAGAVIELMPYTSSSPAR